jgi:cytochrome c553
MPKWTLYLFWRGAIGVALWLALSSAWAAEQQAGVIHDSLGTQGARIAARGGLVGGLPACGSCHGAQGEGVAASGVPRLAGQSPAYLVRQIESFAQEARSHPVMSPIAKTMTVEQNVAVAFYYATLDRGLAASGAASAEGRAERGQRLVSVGDDSAQIPACIQCHGPGGKGELPAYPSLAGQHASYLVNALTQWKNGHRSNDHGGQMQAIASRLSAADMTAVAAYYASQPPVRHAGAYRPSVSPRKSVASRDAPALLPSALCTPPQQTGTAAR